VQVQVGVERNLEVFGGFPEERDLLEKQLGGSGGSPRSSGRSLGVLGGLRGVPEGRG